MNNMLRIVILVFSTICTYSAFASTYSGKIESIQIRDSDGLVSVIIKGERNGNIPACTNNYPYMMIKNENSQTGKRQLALLMMAQAANKTVYIVGSNTCTRWVDGEDIDILQISK